MNDGNKIIQSQSYNNTHEVNADWIKWENEARERYLQNEKNQRAIKSNAVLLEEGLIIIGTDVNVKEKDIEKIVKDFVAKFEKDNNTKVRHWAYHNHEGHEEDGKEHINRHVHFIFDNVNNDGVMVRRNWKRDYFKQMQTDIFDISKKYIKNIERAKESEYEEVEIEDRIVKVNTRKQIHHRVFRQMKGNEQIENLNLKFTDMMKERDETKKENSTLKGQNTKLKNEKGKLKEELQALKDESKDLRAELQLNKAEREAYQQLDYLNKDLQEQLKTGRKSFNEAMKELEVLREKLLKKEDEVAELEEVKKENEYLKSSIEIKEIDIIELKNAQTTLKDELKEVISQCEVLNFDKKELKEANKALQEQKIVLEGKVTTLEQKTASEPNIVPQKEIIDEIQKIISEEFTKKEILESRMGKATPAIIVKDSDSFLKRFKNIASQGIQSVANSVNSLKKEINEWKEKYNSLLEVLNLKDKEIANLKEKVRELSTKQQEKRNEKALEKLVENMEAKTESKSESSLLNEKKINWLRKV